MNQASAQALQQALIAAADDPSARSTAVALLRGAELWAATWPTDPATLRTLTNSTGVTALAVFSDPQQLELAAMRYAWLGLDGKVPAKLLHISEAMRFAKNHRAQLVVVDIAADHALELDEGEMELLASTPSHRPPPPSSAPEAMRPGSEPPAGLSSMRPPSQSNLPPASLKPSQTSIAPTSARPASQSNLPPTSARPASQSNLPPTSARPPSQTAVDPVRVSTKPTAHTVHKPSSVHPPDMQHPDTISATFGASNTATLLGLKEPPSDAFYDALSEVLRDYPEVEWACVVRASRGPGEPSPTIAVRVDPSFRKNLNEINVKLREASIAQGAVFDVLLLDTPEQMKNARQLGRPFYPWRKK